MSGFDSYTTGTSLSASKGWQTFPYVKPSQALESEPTFRLSGNFFPNTPADFQHKNAYICAFEIMLSNAKNIGTLMDAEDMNF